jgi:hypothetical protein
MDFATIQPWGIYASMIAVVVSVIGLSFQIRINTRSLRSYSYSRALDRLAAVQAKLSADASLTELFFRGVRDNRSLTVVDRMRFTWIFYEMFGAFEFIHDEAKSGALPDGVWKRWDTTLAWWLSLPGVVEWWKTKPTPFGSEFSLHVDRRIARPGYDAGASRRWREFLEGRAETAT